MPRKLMIATLLLVAAPTFAFAYCSETRMKPDGSMCPENMLYDSTFALCVEKPTG